MRLFFALLVLTGIGSFLVHGADMPSTVGTPKAAHVTTVNPKPPETAAAPVVAPQPAVQAAPAVEPSPVETPAPVVYSHEDLMRQAGIATSDFGAVDYIISHESSWNPNATEPTTLAHGLPQALPYSKTGCGYVDAVCQLQWADTYATARYGGWWGAYNYWVAHRNW